MQERNNTNASSARPEEDDVLGLEVHSFVVHGSTFHVPKQYDVMDPIGQGAYGVVCSASCRNSDESVAIKKIENVFEHITFTKRTLRELRILRHLQHENIIGLRDVFLPESKQKFDDVYVVSELMETDLASILKSSQPISDAHCQFFLYQILRGVKFMHSAEIVHRDLKPRNLLVNSNCDLKICDFGLARVNFSNEEFGLSPHTEYVCTRWYRAPEVLCCWTDYTEAVDVWSIGCIFAEMLGRKALFPGHNSQHQLQLIIAFLGTISEEEIEKIPNVKCKRFVKNLGKGLKRKSFEAHFPNATPAATGLLNGFLCFNPEKRLHVNDALNDLYLAQLHFTEDEPTRGPVSYEEFEFERRKITMEVLREELFREALHYHPEKRKRYFEKQTTYDIRKWRLLDPGEILYVSDGDTPT